MQGLIGILEGLSLFLMFSLSAIALVPLALAYVALRVRDARAPEPDPQLGAKAAYHLIHSIGILMVLIGCTVSLIDLLTGTIAPKPAFQQGAFPLQQAEPKEPGFNAAHRTAVALAGVGTLFALIFWGFLLSTNDRSHRAVRRVFVGGRMTLCLLISITSVAALTVVLVQKEPNYKASESILAVVFVWLVGAIVHMVLFKAATYESRSRRRRDPVDDTD